MKPLSLLCCVLLAILTCQAAFAANSLWSPPEMPKVPTDLPRLTQPLVLDGDLGEWASAASVPILGKSHIFSKPDEHIWNGPADAGMEVYCAWNSDGLCLAARIADNEIINDQSQGRDYYMQDCVEIFLDGRTGSELMSFPYSFGAYQALVRPPMPGKPVDVGMNPRDGKIEGLKYAGRSTKTGYNIEMLVPWSAFPKFKPISGSLFGMQFALDDWDKRDEKFHDRLQLAYQAQALLSQRPDLFIKWRLTDSLSDTSIASLGVQTTLDTSAVFSGSKPLNAGIQIGSTLAPRVGSVDMRWVDSAGKVLLEKTVKPSRMAEPWSSILSANAEYLPKQIADGYGIFSATVIGKDNAVLQTVSMPVLSVGGVLPDTLARIKKADVAKLSQTQPFKAAQYMAAAACVEKMKRGIEIEDGRMTVAAAQQVRARLDVLEGNPVGSDAGIYGLTTLTADPDAQVIIEYPDSNVATIQLLCGSIPFAWASVEQMGSENDTTAAVMKGTYRKNYSVLADLSEPATIAGLPARVSMLNYNYVPVSNTKDLDPAENVVVADCTSRQMIALEAEHIDYAMADAAVILDNCPDAVRQAVESWSSKHSVPIIKVDDIQKGRVLFAGDLTGAEIAQKLKGYSLRSYKIEDNYCDIKAAWGKNMIWAMGPSRPAAERLIGLIKAGKPITSTDADAMRQEILKTVNPNLAVQPLPKGSNMYCGDLHMHTFYSDGNPSPIGLMCEAVYVQHDFDAITDHDKISGAKYACKLFNQFKAVHPIIVGEEVTTFFHANAYPLKEVVDPSKPLYDITKAAHAQGAVIQWNHPGWPESDWADSQLNKGLVGTSFDAWEHIPPYYDEWKSAGKLPPLVGSTDTHNGTYAWGERTVVISPSTDGTDIAECIRSNRIALVCPLYGHLIYGPDDVVASVFAVLTDGTSLKEAKALDLKNTLKDIDLVGLLSASSPRVVEE